MDQTEGQTDKRTNRIDETIYPFGIMNLNIRVEVQVDPNVDG